MPLVVVTFFDGEILYAETPEISFDLPVIEAEIRNVDANSERALLPLTAIRQLIVGDVEAAPLPAVLSEWDRAAFHFADGQVLRASIHPEVMLGQHGGIWRIVEPGSDELRTLAVPYAALKGVFQIRQWDNRSPLERNAEKAGRSPQVELVVNALAERERRSTHPLWQRVETPFIEKLRRRSDSSHEAG